MPPADAGSRNILETICEHVRGVTAERERKTSLAEMRRLAESTSPTRDFAAALRSPSLKSGGARVALIAEAKKASPSKGLLVADFDPVRLARVYEAAGASAISVLTEERFFQGAPEFLTAVKQAVTLPILRKDFILSEYQVHESRAMGADAILLIVRALDDAELASLCALARELGLAALVEVHDERERERALRAGAAIIGVNNRNLDTFAVDLATTVRLAEGLPSEITLVGESGIRTRDDVARLREAGVHAILVGESLVTQTDIPTKIAELIDA